MISPRISSIKFVRRALAAFLLFVFSLPSLASALAASDPESNLPPCCRRAGKHHCAMMTPHRQLASGPRWQAARCPLYPSAQTAPACRIVSAAVTSTASVPALISYPAIRPQMQLSSRESFSHGWRKRGPPLT